MKVGRLGPSWALALDDVAEPVSGDGEVIVALAACGVCGTDLEKLRGRYRTAGRLGHEPVGRVEAVGPGVTGVSRGDRVFVHHHVPCLQCEVCRKGHLTFCPEYSKSNIDPGGFAEKFRVPKTNVDRGAVLRLSDSVDWSVGALLEPAGCALTALRTVGFREGDSVFIAGLGPVGLLYARLARSLGASWVGGTELSPLRRRAAEEGGMDVALDPREPEKVRSAVLSSTGGAGVDLAVVATAAPAATALAYRVARRAGTLNLFGLPEPDSRFDVDVQEWYLRGIRVVPTYATTERDIADVHALLVSGRLRVNDLVTHRVPLAQLTEAFRLAGTPGEAIKVVVTGPAFDGPPT